ncbi:MAG: DUF928 domain-containing protein [Crocosphaera sp.]|nr:DUF928 domain-containing protein [Crocosphaera sp.]
MFNQTSINTSIGILTFTSFILLSLSNLVTAQTTANDNNYNAPNDTEESIEDLVPDRRKGGASRRPQTPENNNSQDVAEAPQRRKPAGTRPVRNQCEFNPQELIALIPENLVGSTVTTSPTLYFSVPSIAASTDIEFVLRGPNDELVEKQTFLGRRQAGIMALQLPRLPHISSSNPNHTYHWYLSVICNEVDRSHDVVVEGLLKPVTLESNAQQQLEEASPQEQIQVYQSYQVWHETLHTLAQMKRSQPQNAQISQQLGQLLELVKLEASLAQQPLLEPEMLSLNR